MADWHAEHDVDERLAAELIGAQFPQLAGVPVVRLDAGWDNTVHVVDGWAFRFPRRTLALALQERERRLLPALATHLPVPVPVPELVGRPQGAYPWPFTGARLLPGVELAETDLDDGARVALAVELAGVLRVLHDPALAPALGGGLPVDPNRRADPAARADRSLPWLERLFDDVPPPVQDLFADAAPLGPSTAPPVLVHGDLHVRHVLVEAGRVSGVLDWGDACLADPSVDLALAYAAFTGPARSAFFEAYGEVDRPTGLRARVLAVSLSAALAAYAVDEGRDALRDEALAGLVRAVGD